MSTLTVAGAPTSIPAGGVSVTLNSVTHDFPDDIDVLLVGPTGASVVLMSDAGNGTALAAVDITLAEPPGPALPPLPDESEITSGTYAPSNYGPTAGCTEDEPDSFAGAPAGPYGASLSVFDGTDPNGDWDLYVVDDCTLFAPVNCICGGWTLELSGPTAVAVTRLSAASRGRSVAVRWRTAAETDVAGFNLYRSSGARTLKLNRSLIAAKRSGRSAGAGYTFVDRRPSAGSSTYRLQTVDLSGKRSWAASVSLSSSR
ncbi:MAG: hypothetical protein ABR521_09880 [Gaiellaceae bacterium]